MFFDSLLRRKQSGLGTGSPRYEGPPTSREPFTGNGEIRNDLQPRQRQKKVIINRSKSQKQLNPNPYPNPYKHPILARQKHQGRPLNPVHPAPLYPNEQTQSRKQIGVKSKQTVCEKHRRNFESCRSGDFNQYDLRNFTKTSSGEFKPRESRPAGEGFPGFGAFCESRFRENSGAELMGSIMSNPNPTFLKRNSSQQIQILSPFSLEQHKHEFLEQQTTKMSQADYDSSLRATVKNLEKHILAISQERDKERNKMLEYSINLGKLQLENQCLRKNSAKSKENIQAKGNKGEKGEREKGEVAELKRLLKEESEHKQSIQRQRQNLLTELNQALIAQQAQKSRFQKQKKTLKTKLDSLQSQLKQKKSQNVALSDKIAFICSENRKLRESSDELAERLAQKEREGAWMNGKVNDLKEALEYLKLQGNERIQKLEDELLQVESKRKEQSGHQIRQLQDRLREKDNALLEANRHSEELNTKLKESRLEVEELKKQLGHLREETSSRLSALKQQAQRYKILSLANQEQKKVESKLVQKLEQECQMLSMQKKKLTEELKEQNSLSQSLKKSSQSLQMDLQNKDRELLETKYKLQSNAKELETKESALQESNRGLASLKDQNAELNQKLMEIESKYESLAKQNRQKVQEQANKSSYTQLEMRLCGLLGIYLTSSIDKIISPIEQLLRSRKQLESASRNYDEIVKLFDWSPKESPNRLLNQIRQCKTGYRTAMDNNQRLQNEITRFREENLYLMERFEDGMGHVKRLEPLLDYSNQWVIKLRLRLENQRYSVTGTRKQSGSFNL